jgi:hypothetical protein
MEIISSIEARRKSVMGKAYKPLSVSSSSAKPSGGFAQELQSRRQAVLQQSKQQPKPQIATKGKPTLDLNKAVASGGLRNDTQLAKQQSQKVWKDYDHTVDKIRPLMNFLDQPYPEAHFADKLNFFTPKGFAYNMAQGLYNTPAEAIKGASSLGKHAAAGDSKPRQVGADIAAAAQLPLLFVTGGASTVAKQGVVQAAKAALNAGGRQVVKAVAKETAIGAGFGILSGVQSGRDIENWKDYLKNLAVNVGIGAAAGGGIASVSHIALPLAKGLSSKLGAVFVKDANTPKPKVASLNLHPKVAQSMVMNNEKLQQSPVGKKIIATSLQAQQTDMHIEITPNKKGEFASPTGQKFDVQVVPEAQATKHIDTFEKNIDEYRRYGGHSDGTETENAALRDVTSLTKEKDVVEHTQSQVKKAIKEKTLQVDKDGNVTLYRGGEVSPHNELVSASYDKDVAKVFADNAGTEVTEIKVKPEAIKAFIGKSEGEVLIDKVAVTGEKNTRVETENIPKETATIENPPPAVKPVEEKPKVEPAKAQPKQPEVNGAQEPVGAGKTKESAAYKHRLEALAESDPAAYEYILDKNGKVTYNVNRAKDDMEKAGALLEKDPQKAFDVAMGYEATPQGQTTNAVAMAVSDRAAQEKNFDLVARVETKMSLRSTRGGQENAALRGRFDSNSPHKFIQQVIDERMRRLGRETELTKNINLAKKALGKVTTSAKERAVAKIDAAVERARTFTKKERAKIDFAQKLLDELTCK